MAAVGVGSKYHLALNGVGYLFRGKGYSKQDARSFAPRFGTGNMGESDLDLYKVISQDDFSGGMNQELFNDMTKVSVLADAIRNPFDELVHPTPASTAKALPTGTVDGTPAWAVYKGILYKSTNYYNSGFKGAIAKYDAGAWTNIKTDFGNAVTDMMVYKNLLIVMAGASGIWQWDGTTWANWAPHQPWIGAVFNGILYDNGTANRGTLYTFSAINSSTTIGNVGDENLPIQSMAVFNHRLYMGKPDGLFAYDGVQISCIIDTSKAVNYDNFKFLSELEGSLYWITRNIIFKFNGSTVEKIQDMTNLQTIKSMTSGYGRLWITTYGDSSYLITGGKGGYAPANGYLLYCYDGLGLALYDDTKYGVYSPYGVAISGSTLFYFVSGASAVVDSTSYLIDLSTEFKAGTMNDAIIRTSHFDCGFPNVDKYFDSIEVDYENIIVGDTITVKFRTYDGKVYTSWQTLGTITSTSTNNRLYLQDTTYSGVFKKLQIEITIDRAATSNLALRGYSFKYLLSPDYKRQWQLSLICQGQSDIPLELLDGTQETVTARSLRDNIYLAKESDAPIGFEDIDITTLTGNHTNIVATITAGDTKAFPSAGYIKIDDEIIAYTGRTATSFTGCTRGKLGTTAASHTGGATINEYFRVVVTKIMNESVITPSTDSYGTESELTLELVEV